jgi:hypothetical protein
VSLGELSPRNRSLMNEEKKCTNCKHGESEYVSQNGETYNLEFCCNNHDSIINTTELFELETTEESDLEGIAEKCPCFESNDHYY